MTSYAPTARYRAVPIIIAVFCVQWLLLSAINHPSWDGAYYYSYARSLVYDGDLHLANDLQLSYPAAPDFANKNNHLKLTPTGHIENFFAPGAAVQWLPWLVVARPFSHTGYEPLVLQTAAAFTTLLGVCAFGLMMQISRRFAPSTAVLATVTMMGCTPLLFYQFRDPFYAHVPSAVVATLVLFYWLRIEQKPRPRQLVLLGMLLGLGTLIRWQSVVYGVLPAFTLLWHGVQARQKFRRLAASFLWIALGAFAIVVIQLMLWKIYYGNWITIPQGDSFINWRASWWRPLLFSRFRGIIAWFPVFLPGFFGLIVLAKRRPRIAIPMLIVICLQFYINASTRDWFGGGGFGLRRFSSEIPLLLVGYAVLLARLPMMVRYGLTLGLMLHQWTLLRYGLSEKLGGRVVSMIPDFRWSEDSWATFLSQLGSYATNAVTRPRDFWVLHGSPVATLLDGEWPALHLGALAMAAAFLAVCGLIGAAAWHRWRSDP